MAAMKQTAQKSAITHISNIFSGLQLTCLREQISKILQENIGILQPQNLH